MDSNEYNNNSDEGFGAFAWLVVAFLVFVGGGILIALMGGL